MMLYKKKTKVMVRRTHGNTDFFDFVAGVLQGDTLASFLFIIWLDFVLRISGDLMIENGARLHKVRSRCYPTETITDHDMQMI